MPDPCRRQAHGPAARYLDALSFLSRLVVRPGQTEGRFQACLSGFAPAGLTLGLLWAGLAFAALRFADVAQVPPALCPLVAGWLWMLALLWTTRALHWDGVADLADACGSGAAGERFWQIMRDSRLGAFGALAVCSGLAGALLLAAAHAAQGNWLLLVLAPGWGRACSLLLAASAPPQGGGSLGRLVCSAMTPRLVRQQRAWLCGMLLLAWLAGTPLWQCLLLLAGHLPLQGRLRRTALAHGGLSGDFLGADIELTQLWFLLALL